MIVRGNRNSQLKLREFLIENRNEKNDPGSKKNKTMLKKRFKLEIYGIWNHIKIRKRNPIIEKPNFKSHLFIIAVLHIWFEKLHLLIYSFEVHV
jgi:hypothetical protein